MRASKVWKLTLLLLMMLTLRQTAQAEGKKWALLIGIEEYDRAEIAHLDFAVKDVNAIARTLQDNLGYEAANIRTMTSAIKDFNDPNRPTNDNVLATLERLAKSVGPDDTFLFYFTGHGFNKDGENFLASVNANPLSVNTLRRSAIPLTDLQQTMQSFRAKQILFVIDACRNDPEKAKGAGDNKLSDDFSKSLVVASRSGQAGGGSGVLFACSEGERAFEDPTKGQSVFTYYLLEAMSGKAGGKGPLAMGAVVGYVRKQVGAWADEHGKKQTPELLPQEADRLVLTDKIAAAMAPVEQASVKVLDTQGALLITSDPAGADVIVGGKSVGKTPFTLTVDLGLEEKKTVQIGLALSGYKARAFEVEIARGKALSVPPITLQPAPTNPEPQQPMPALKKPTLPGGGGRQAGQTKINPKDGAEMVFIPAGAFLMGDDDLSDNPRHSVTLSGYWMYKNLVTVKQYKQFCSDTGRQMPPEPVYKDNHFNPGWSKEDHPIVNVSWDDALAYATWAGVSLPTEAQWEKAARGIDGRKYPWGNDFDATKVWASKAAFGDAGGTTSVGQFGISVYGCTDMAGNVFQWCSDWYDEKFWNSLAAKISDPENQSVGEQKDRVLRGGSWDDTDPDTFRAAYRKLYEPTGRNDFFGFRCASK